MNLFFFLSKVLTLFLFPLPIAILLGFFVLKFVEGRKNKILVSLPILFLLFFSSFPVAQFLIRTLESEFPPVRIEEVPESDVIVVLGGAINPMTYYPERVEILSAGDRMTESVLLFRNRKAPLLLFTGGSGVLFQQKVSESDSARKFFLDFGVPEDFLLIEGISRNTKENAIETAKILRENGLNKIILVTSAFHMKRSLGVFQKEGLEVFPFPTDYRALRIDVNWDTIIPSVGALDTSTIALKEWIGIMAYKLKGFM